MSTLHNKTVSLEDAHQFHLPSKNNPASDRVDLTVESLKHLTGAYSDSPITSNKFTCALLELIAGAPRQRVHCDPDMQRVFLSEAFSVRDARLLRRGTKTALKLEHLGVRMPPPSEACCFMLCVCVLSLIHI